MPFQAVSASGIIPLREPRGHKHVRNPAGHPTEALHGRHWFERSSRPNPLFALAIASVEVKKTELFGKLRSILRTPA